MSKEEQYLFETEDVFGETVKLKKSTWEYYVINEHAERKNFKGKEEFLRTSLKTPI
ncbi:hypothetical protein ACWEYQ_01845 [Staphylococcus xylosus]